MLLLADAREIADRLVPPGTVVRPAARHEAGRLPAGVAEALLGGRAPAWAADLPSPAWPLALAVAEAPRSQFDALAALGDGPDGPPDRFLALAGTGRGFHGQRDRPWVALPGNLHLVAFARVDLPAASTVGPLAALPAVAVVAALDTLPGLAGKAGIKWVNDVLLDGRKVAGVLTRTWTRGPRVSALLLGIGLNVEATPQVPDDPLARGVTSLAAFVGRADAPPLAAAFRALADALGTTLDLLAAGRGQDLVERYRERSLIVGREVLLIPDPRGPATGEEEPLRGRVLALGDDLALHLAGAPRPVRRGRLRVLD